MEVSDTESAYSHFWGRFAVWKWRNSISCCLWWCHPTEHRAKAGKRGRAGDGELHSRGSGEVMGALMAGEVSASLGSCLWLMESRDCLGIPLVHLNISIYYKCSQKMKCRSSLGSPGIRSMGFLKCRDGSRQMCESLNLDPFGLFLECLVERKCHFYK